MNVLALLVSFVVLGPVPAGQISLQRTVSMNEPFEIGGLTYRVTQVRDGLKSYLQKYDQRLSTLSPGFSSERLVVMQVDVENPGETPKYFAGVLPTLTYGDGSVTDRAQWDVEQKSWVRTNNELHLNAQGDYGFTHDPVLVAPGGHARFAVAFSHPLRSKATRISFEPGKTVVISGTLITQPAPGRTTIVNLG